jgi:hypothetical protein
MDAKPHRTFTLGDVLILIAALAVGLAWMCDYQHGEQARESYPVPDYFPRRHLLTPFVGVYRAEVAAWWTVCLYHVVAPVTLAVLVARFRKPRPRLRRIARQPGTVGCAAAVLAVIAELARNCNDAIYSLQAGHPWYEFNTLAYWDLDGAHPGLAVGAVWLLLAVSGCWKPERDWVDRAGIGLSLFWLIVPTANWPT